MGDSIDVDEGTVALEGWLARRLDGAADLRLTPAGKPSSGFSAETSIFWGDYEVDGQPRRERFVLRRETPDPPVYPSQVPGLTTEVEIQYRVMAALAEAGAVPLAPLHGYEADPSVLGAPFFVMGFVDGQVPIESPMYTVEGFFTELAPPRREAMLRHGVEAMAAVHRLDWSAAGLGWLVAPGATPGTRAQLDLWRAYGERELGERRHPVWERALAWLEPRLPDTSELSLCWGDPRPGNIIWADDRPRCLTDFEAACIAPPEVDLGWWLMSDRWAHEITGIERLEGEPTRAEQTAAYEAALGRAVGDTTWWEVFAATRYTAIVVRVMNRVVERGHMPADHTIWLENPAAACLAQLLDEVGA